MKIKSVVLLSAAVLAAGISGHVLAQKQGVGGSVDRVAEAIMLLKNGKPGEATNVLAAVVKGDPQFGVAQGYRALALYDLKDALGFLDALKTPEIKEAALPPEVREELDAKQVEKLFFYRQFDELLVRAKEFKVGHAGSMKAGEVEEYRIAALFERGMKKTWEACRSQDTNVFNVRWPEGKANLEEFQVAAQSLTNYAHLPKHQLKEDLWVARMTLGDEQAVVGEIPATDVAARERLAFLRAQLYFKLQPEKLDRNLGFMQDFVKQYPKSKDRHRIEFNSATITHRRGKELWEQAEAAARAGDVNGAAAKRAEADRYFGLQQAVGEWLTVNKAAGIEASDVFDQQEDLLTSYLFQRNFAKFSEATAALLKKATPGDLNWVLAKLNMAIALQIQDPPQSQEAAAGFDEVLAQGFKGKSDHDHLVIEAARWRLDLALKAGDVAKAREIVRWVQAGNGFKALKTEFMKDHGWALGVNDAANKEK